MSNALKEISDERLAVLMQQFTPLYRDMRDGGKLWKCELPDLRKTSFIWAPVKLEEVTDFQPVASIITLHDGFLFKPSIAEVLACVEDETLLGNAFHIGNNPYHSSEECWAVTTHFGTI